VLHAAESQHVSLAFALPDAEVLALKLLEVVVDHPQLFVSPKDEELVPGPRCKVVLHCLKADVPPRVAVVLAFPLACPSSVKD
jgi:hypothetical protein